MEERELELVEIVEEVMSSFEYGPEILTYPDDGDMGDMTTEQIELGKATIAYLAMRLLPVDRMKRSGAYKSNAGWVAMRKYEAEVFRELADFFGIEGDIDAKAKEVKRLYNTSSIAQDQDEAYREKVEWVIQSFEEKYELDPKALHIIFVNDDRSLRLKMPKDPGKHYGPEFAQDMAEDPNMGMNPKWIEKHLDEVPEEIRRQYEARKRASQNKGSSIGNG